MFLISPQHCIPLEPLQEEKKSTAGSLIVYLLWKRSDVLNPDQCPKTYELELKRSVTSCVETGKPLAKLS